MLYLAGPLFTQAEQAWLRGVKAELVQHGHEVCWPFELFSAGQIAQWGPMAPRRIMERCREALDASDTVVAWIDGTQVDDGTAWEIGCFFSAGKRVFGLRTDIRRAGETDASRVNLMIECSCCALAGSLDELLANLKSL